MSGKQYKIYMCRNQRAGGAGCINPSATLVFDALTLQAAAHEEDIEIINSTCLGYCSEGPNAKIHGGAVFNKVKVADVADILDAVKPKRPERRARKKSVRA